MHTGRTLTLQPHTDISTRQSWKNVMTYTLFFKPFFCNTHTHKGRTLSATREGGVGRSTRRSLNMAVFTPTLQPWLHSSPAVSHLSHAHMHTYTLASKKKGEKKWITSMFDWLARTAYTPSCFHFLWHRNRAISPHPLLNLLPPS